MVRPAAGGGRRGGRTRRRRRRGAVPSLRHRAQQRRLRDVPDDARAREPHTASYRASQPDRHPSHQSRRRSMILAHSPFGTGHTSAVTRADERVLPLPHEHSIAQTPARHSHPAETCQGPEARRPAREPALVRRQVRRVRRQGSRSHDGSLGGHGRHQNPSRRRGPQPLVRKSCEDHAPRTHLRDHRSLNRSHPDTASCHRPAACALRSAARMHGTPATSSSIRTNVGRGSALLPRCDCDGHEHAARSGRHASE